MPTLVWSGVVAPPYRRSIGTTRGDAILFSEAIAAEGALVFAKACEMGCEGIVSKRVGSMYWSGRCRNWTKARNPAFQRG